MDAFTAGPQGMRLPHYNQQAGRFNTPTEEKMFLSQQALGLNQRYQKKLRAGQYAGEQVALDQQNDAERLRREGALTDLDKALGSPERMAGMEKLYSTGLQNQIGGLQHNFQQASQHAGLIAARRGRLGSSFDTEQQAGLRHGLQQDVLGAENEAYGGLQALRSADENQRQALRRALMSGDPQTAAALNQQAQGYGLETQQLLQRQRDQEESRRRQEQQQQQGYQTLGNVLSSAGAGVQNYYYGRGY